MHGVRTAAAAQKGLQSGLTLAFRAGAITGLLVAGLALLAIAVFYWVLTVQMGRTVGGDDRTVVDGLVALAFGASLISIFARRGGGKDFSGSRDFSPCTPPRASVNDASPKATRRRERSAGVAQG